MEKFQDRTRLIDYGGIIMCRRLKIFIYVMGWWGVINGSYGHCDSDISSQALEEKIKKLEQELSQVVKQYNVQLKKELLESQKTIDLNQAEDERYVGDEDGAKPSHSLPSHASMMAQYNQAVAIYKKILQERKAIENQKKDGKDLDHLARIGIANFEQIIKKYPDSSLVFQCYGYIGDIQLHQGNFRCAIDAFTQSSKGQSATLQTTSLIGMGQAYKKLGDKEKIKNIIEELKKNGLDTHLTSDQQVIYKDLTSH
jgi:tetratricopeptide (TPR) repeat protein